MKTKNKISIIGAGVVGTALGYLLNKSGYHVVGIASRTLSSAKKAGEFIGERYVSTDLAAIARKADIVFITTSDRSIESACRKIAAGKGFRKGAIVFHTCGALPSSVLLSAKKNGACIASFHPLQSCPSVQEAIKRIRGSYFFIEGDEAALKVARKIIIAFQGKEITLTVNTKTLYHAGACAASNFLVATVGLGLELFEAAGINRVDALRALMPLIKGTVKNIEKLGVPSALTGPIARGDADIIEDHLKAMAKEREDLTALYSELGRYTVRLGIGKRTLKEKEAKKIIALFNTYQKGKKI
jgi:predicted short-subunit dehydrogenase-like oxidoreductase (DUF2520 family)